MRRLYGVAIALAACGHKDQPASTGSGAPPAGSAVAAAPADAAPPAPPTGPGYELLAAAATRPPPGGLVGKEPPTQESLHLELSYALANWAAHPRDKNLYAKDFGGRDVADGRVDLIPYDEWIQKLPERPAQTANPSIATWLDPMTQLTLSEAKVNIEYFYDHKDQSRELMWRREDGHWHLYSETTSSENSRDEFSPLRNWLPVDAKGLGKNITARWGTENTFAWLALENGKGAQVIVDMWPWSECTEADAPKDALAKLRCSDGGDGKDFVVVQSGDSLAVHLTPAGKDAPMSTDRTISLPHGAKVTFKPATAKP